MFAWRAGEYETANGYFEESLKRFAVCDDCWSTALVVHWQAHLVEDMEREKLLLLLNRNEIARLTGKVAERGLTLVPLSIYFKNGRAKVELGLARGKRMHDKRETIRRREEEREIERAVRDRERA